jgi:hypothetical protein
VLADPYAEVAGASAGVTGQHAGKSPPLHDLSSLRRIGFKDLCKVAWFTRNAT